MTDEEASQILHDEFGKVNLGRVREALGVLQERRAFITGAHLDGLLIAVTIIQQFQNVHST